MKMLTNAFITLSILFIFSPSSSYSEENHQEFFEKHCIRCHGPKKAKAKLRLNQLKWDENNKDILEIWQDIIDQLEEGEMPPKDESQPDKAQVIALTSDIKKKFMKLKGSGPQVILKRLNRKQYHNTVRDLLNVNVLLDNPADPFPTDGLANGFDNVAESLIMSDFMLTKVLNSARKIVDKSTYPEKRPLPEKHVMGKISEKKKGGKRIWPHFTTDTAVLPDGSINLVRNDENEPGDTRGQSCTSSRNGVPLDGFYEFVFEVESKGRGNAVKLMERMKNPRYQKYHSEDLHRLEIYYLAPSGKSAGVSQNRILIESFDLTDNKTITIKRRYWLDKGWKIQLTFGNAAAFGRLQSNYYERISGQKLSKENNEAKKEFVKKIPSLINKIVEEKNLPRIKIHSASQEGPFYDTWPPLSHQRVYGKPGQSVEMTIQQFASRAFRRSVALDEIQDFVSLAKNSPEGIRTAIEAILCSSEFLYIIEDGNGPLDHCEIANRLSYFLWNTMPNERLMKLAAGKKLQDKTFLKKITREMLADVKSEEFVKNFIWAWLRLQHTIEMSPDSVKFVNYKRYRIGTAMVKETETFFKYILNNNLPTSLFVDSNFIFVNADLARWYGLPNVDTTVAFKKITLKPNSVRGGLLGQASVLTASANGVDTSPVTRGLWILENILGIKPAPPPVDIEIPEIDLRGKMTIKQLYAKHRNVESCSSCHKKIDPLGFALENFNPVGVWRTQYTSGEKIDPTGYMPDGTAFNGINGLKQNILRNMTLFNRGLISKLLTYATGRHMTTRDRVIIDKLVNKATKEKTGFRDLILEIVTSDIFMNK